MKYQIGDVIESGGVKRKVTGFTAVSGELFPNTELYDEDEPMTGVNEVAAVPTAPETPELKCQYCGKPYKDASWLASHEEKCPQNPANGEK